MTFAYETPELTEFACGIFAAGVTKLKEGDGGEQNAWTDESD